VESQRFFKGNLKVRQSDEEVGTKGSQKVGSLKLEGSGY
jgi:hypothetical protein